MPLSPEAMLEGLTPPQRLAATTIDGPLLVLAGAGSGKTRTITRRVAYMVACGIPAYNILALTFTNKATTEMRERIAHLLSGAGRQGKGITVATFHGLCARTLRDYADVLSLPKSFTIFDSSDQNKLIKQAIKDSNLNTDNFQPAAVLSAISAAKNKLQSTDAFAASAASFFDKNVARVYLKYEALLKENKGVDFDDLLLKTALMLRDNKTVREQLQDRYQYLLIDEYQDTNHAQFVIAHMLAMNHKNICATGDPDQSIYGWRGANLNNILEFEQFYPNAKVVLLEQNYRSTKIILQAASALIAHNTKRKKKDLWTDNESGPPIQVLKNSDEHQEAAEIVKRLKQEHDQQKLTWDKFAIFYRTNSLSRVLEDALMKAAVPYQIARGTEFYARKEIKDMLAYLRVVANPDDNVSFERIVNVPPRGLGDTSTTRLASFAATQNLPWLQAAAIANEAPDLTPRAATALKKLATLFTEWSKQVRPSTTPPTPPPTQSSVLSPQSSSDPLFDMSLADALEDSEEYTEGEPASPPPTQSSALSPQSSIRGLMEKIYRESGLEAELKKDDDADNDKAANVEELITVAAEFDLQNPLGTLDDYLEQVALVTDVDKAQDAGGSVTLMTLHAAKGLEFPVVAIAGCEDGLIPHSRAISGFSPNPDELEEERRLFFVGITRAMKKLILSYAQYRMIRGLTERTIASQFFSELPDETLEEINLTHDGDTLGSVGFRDGQRVRSEHRAFEAAEQREVAAGLAGEFRRGTLVRHPQFGLGRIEDITPAGTMTKAMVKFQGIPVAKTLILQYAKLEKVDS